MEEIKRGDVVVLKSGGQKMTAGNLLVGNKFEVYWFAGDDLRSAEVFKDSLKLYVPTPDIF